MPTVNTFPLTTKVATPADVGLGNVPNIAPVQNNLNASTTVAPSATAVQTALDALTSSVAAKVQDSLTASTTVAPSATAVNGAITTINAAIAAKVQNNLNASTTVAPSATAVQTALDAKVQTGAIVASATIAPNATAVQNAISAAVSAGIPTDPTLNGVVSQAGATTAAGSAMGALVIDVTKARNTKTVSAASTFTFSVASGSIPEGRIFGLELTTSTAALMTIPSSFSAGRQTAITTFYMPVGTVFLTFIKNGTQVLLFGDTPATNNYAATAAPTTGADNTQGYAVGSFWFDTTNDQAYANVDATTGAAIWRGPIGSGGGVTDGDKGDITVSGSGATWTLDNSTVTNAKLANIATASVKGRVTAATGVVEDLTATQLTTLINPFTTALKGAVPASGGGTANFLRADGTWSSPGSGSGITDGDKGDIVVSGSSAVWTIDANAVDNTKLAQVATATFKGRTTASTGNVEDLTAAQAAALLPTATVSAKGLLPVLGGGTTNFLRADGTWATPAGGGSSAYPYSAKYWFENDFHGTSASQQGNLPFVPANGAYLNDGLDAFLPGRIGVVRLDAPTTLNAGGTFVGPFFNLDAGDIFEASWAPSTASVTAGRIGQSDAFQQGASANGAYFDITSGAVMARLQATNGSVNVNSTVQAGVPAFTLVDGTYYRFLILVLTTTSVKFSIFNDANTEVWTATLTGAIPNQVNRQSRPQFTLWNSTAGGGTLAHIDYVNFGTTRSLPGRA